MEEHFCSSIFVQIEKMSQATSALCPFIFSKLKELTATHCSKSNLSKISFNRPLLKHHHCHGQCDCNKSNLSSAKFCSPEIFFPEGDLHFDKITIRPQMGSSLEKEICKIIGKSDDAHNVPINQMGLDLT